MKEIKAFVRTTHVDVVVRALEAAGAPGITISTAHGVGYGYEARLFTIAPANVRTVPKVAKVEVVCRARDVDRLVHALTEAARTGVAGDGVAFVTPVERAVKIRTGEEGRAILGRKGEAEP
jgi:Nitrogen regulatory protein PII